ncbi:MAG: hypothetical protein PVH11_04590 [Anaerolineae bacterium]|jgi:Flp pilus assembly pilin Flp
MHIHSDEEGQGLVEYGWSVVLVGILLMVVLIALGGAVFGLWQKVWEALQGAFGPEAETLLQPVRYAALHLGLIL